MSTLFHFHDAPPSSRGLCICCVLVPDTYVLGYWGNPQLASLHDDPSLPTDFPRLGDVGVSHCRVSRKRALKNSELRYIRSTPHSTLVDGLRRERRVRLDVADANNVGHSILLAQRWDQDRESIFTLSRTKIDC
jgi:hypothetical protein